MTITAPPIAPTRSTPEEVFRPRADAFMLWLAASVAEYNALGVQVSGDAAAAVAAKVIAEAAAAAAAQSVPSVTVPSTSMSLGTGSKGPMTTNVTVPFYKGQLVVVANDADPTKRMTGVVTAASGTSLTINVPDSSYVDGSGTFTSWRVSLGVKPSGGVPAAADTDLWAQSSAVVFTTPAAMAAAAVFKNAGAASTITLDLNAGRNFELGTNLTGAHILANPSNIGVAKSGIIKAKQPNPAGASLAVGSYWKRKGGLPGLTQVANAEDWILYYCVSTTQILYAIIKAPS